MLTAFDDIPYGMTCQSFFSVSLDPPLVAFSVSKTSTTYPLIRTVGRLAINILSHNQRSVSDGFARSGTDKWRGVPWSVGRTLRQPIISGVLASLECEIENEIEAGDHFLIVARVRGMEVDSTRAPLLFYQGRYRLLADSA